MPWEQPLNQILQSVEGPVAKIIAVIIIIVTGLDYEEADKLLKRAQWNVKAAIVMQKSGLSLAQALTRLRRAHNFVRDAIGEDAEARLKELLGTG